MDRFEPFGPDEEAIEAWINNFEVRLLYNSRSTNEGKRHRCKPLVENNKTRKLEGEYFKQEALGRACFWQGVAEGGSLKDKCQQSFSQK